MIASRSPGWLCQTESMLTIITQDAAEVDGSVVDGRPQMAEADLEAAIGWHLNASGLCRGDVCVPVEPSSLHSGDGSDTIDLTAVAEALDLPVLVDQVTGTVAMGVSRRDRRAALVDRDAQDFSLTDINGVDRALSDWHGKKRLLVAFSSW